MKERRIWRETTRVALLFSDPDLVVRTRLHTEVCRLDRCSCLGPPDFLPVGTTVERLEERQPAELVRVEGARPVWVESVTLGWGSEPRRRIPPVAVPDDFLEGSLVLASGRLPPTRRRPRGGEIVLVRKEVREGTPRLWRFLGSVRKKDEYHLLLVDASVSAQRALDVGQERVCLVACDEERPQDVVRPIFPSRKS